MKKKKGYMKKTIIFIFLMLLFSCAFVFLKIFIITQGEFSNTPIEVCISKGLTVNAIADSLEKYKVIKKSNEFIIASKILQTSTMLKAGKYIFNEGLTLSQIINIIVDGKTATTKIVIPEGFTSYQIASLLARKCELDSVKFITLVNDQEFANNLGIDAETLEGYLYPDTYFFYWGINEEESIKILVNEFQKKLNISLKEKVLDRGWSIHQVITLASIIEGEAVIDSERTIISAVYNNRLERGIFLQADPTIQYIIPDGPRRLLHRDLAIDSPYNTYRYTGLPPGPVNNPGIKSIIAAINPAKVKYIYFVAKGDGSHIFTRTLKQHLAAKRKFDEYRKTVKRKKRLNASKRK